MSMLQAALAWNHDGTLLASASVKGTVLRVHCLPQVEQLVREQAVNMSMLFLAREIYSTNKALLNIA